MTGTATPEQMLREFHLAAGQAGSGFPSAEMRQEMLDSEVQELRDALAAGDRAKVADALADIVYAAVGTAVVMNIPFDAVLAEVHRSNMTKLIPPIRLRDDGKILKGPHYEPPDIAGVLNAAVTRSRAHPSAPAPATASGAPGGSPGGTGPQNPAQRGWDGPW